MSTYTIHPQERHHRTTEWTLQHPLFSTVAALLAAVLAGVLIGILFSIVLAGAPAATQHRAGGHALATVAAGPPRRGRDHHRRRTGQHRHRRHRRRSPTKPGPRRAGRRSHDSSRSRRGFIVVEATRVPARGGFPGRSLGAGHVPGAGLMHATASR